MKKRYRVLWAMEIDGRIYGFGEVVELDAETAKELREGLEEEDGGH